MAQKEKVLVGMSGGVDSSVSALLLQKQGYEVIGAFMKNWSDGSDDVACSWRSERRDAMRVASQLNIPLYTFDYEKEYREHVYEYMIREYTAGRTPNPDVLCNKYMKFGYLLDEAKKLHCSYLATGHYARVTKDSQGIAHLYTGLDEEKDQSYFLCQLNQSVLRQTLFPIGNLQKKEVRDIARKNHLPVADKKDSQGICFIGNVSMQTFLQERIEPSIGNIVTIDGKIIGQHNGYAYYTIGQRTGLGIGGGIPYFVIERRPNTNEIVVVLGDQDPALYTRTVQANDICETREDVLNSFLDKPIKARIRYRQPLQACHISRVGNGIKTVFGKDQKAVAPGQFIAWYADEELLGSGIIDIS